MSIDMDHASSRKVPMSNWHGTIVCLKNKDDQEKNKPNKS